MRTNNTNYKLQDFEPDLCNQIQSIFGDAKTFTETLILLKHKSNGQYNDFEMYALWYVWRRCCRFDNFNLYDRIHEIPQVFDKHLITLLRRSVETLYGHNVPDLLTIYRQVSTENIPNEAHKG